MSFKSLLKKFLIKISARLKSPSHIQANEERDRFHPLSSLPIARDDARLFVDVGAFTGHYTEMALSWYNSCKAIAFEPTSENTEKIRIRLLESPGFINRAVIYRMAVSDKIGDAHLNLTTTGAANSLMRQTPEHSRQNPHVVETGTEAVKTTKLDAIIPADEVVDILKIDVEGLELNVLNGGLRLLERTKFVIVEISLARDASICDQAVFKIFDLMNKRGFSLYSIIDVYAFEKPEEHLGMAQFDAIFKNTILDQL